MYGYLYQNTDKNFSILHALDGYDEISLTSDTKVISNHTESMLKPADFGVRKLEQKEIYGGGTIENSAMILVKILRGEGTEAQENVVCANAGMAIATAKNIKIKEGFSAAKESIKSGKALEALKKLQHLSE
jgi:anthranilate phosphoribosyltransferase